MFRFLSQSASSVALSVTVLALAGCQTAPQQPVDLVHPPVAETADYAGLEGRVRTLEGQMKSAQPTLKKVEVMETHFKALSLELDRISKTYDTPAPENAPVAAAVVPVEKEVIHTEPKKVEKIAPKPVAKKTEMKKPDVKKAEAKKEIVPAGELAVTSVRIGDQTKGMTRIVLDTTKAAELHYDLDNGEGLLVIDIPSAQWKTTESEALKKSPMVKSFHASQDDSGAHLVVDLKQAAKVVATARLKPSGASGHRVYVDVAPAK